MRSDFTISGKQLAAPPAAGAGPGAVRRRRAGFYIGAIRNIAPRTTHPVLASTPIVERSRRVGTILEPVGGPGQ